MGAESTWLHVQRWHMYSILYYIDIRWKDVIIYNIDLLCEYTIRMYYIDVLYKYPTVYTYTIYILYKYTIDCTCIYTIYTYTYNKHYVHIV